MLLEAASQLLLLTDGFGQLGEPCSRELCRSALKTRNSDNQPDAWLKNVLLNFEQRKLNGEQATAFFLQLPAMQQS